MKALPLRTLIILILTVGVIFLRFNQIPKNLSIDEYEFAKLALSLEQKPYTPYSELATGHSTIYFYILLVSFKLFGITNFALRLPSAIFGVLGAWLFYAIMRKLFQGEIVPFLLAVIFITLRWYFTFARFAFEATFLLLLELSVVFFYYSIKNRKDIVTSFYALFFLV